MPYQMRRTRHMDKLITHSGLRIRLFIYNIGNKNPTNCELNQFFMRDISLDVDFFNDSPEEILDQMYNSKFIGYACIIIIINQANKLWRPGFLKLLQAMASNRYLRYKSKLLIMPYGIDGDDNSWDVVFNSYVDFLEEDSLLNSVNDFIYPRGIKRKTTAVRKNINRFRASRDYLDFHSLHLDNTVMLQMFLPETCETARTLDEIFHTVFWDPFQSMQKLCCRRKIVTCAVQSTTNADLYFYAINPALAIIINNYYFTTPPHTMRKGSDRDVAHLIRVLKLAGIPHILVEDCERQELLQIMDYMATKDFTPLKSLMLFLMSHGDQDNVFYTNDGQLDINCDVVQRLQMNPSLKDAEKIVVVNACRGSVDLENDDEDVIKELTTPSDGKPNLTQNTIVFYGVPDGIQSPRSPVLGSPFIQSFCRHFGNNDPTDDVRMIDNRINKDLSTVDYFQGLEKCSDLVLKHPDQHYAIMQVPTKAFQMLKLIESIGHDFPVREPTGQKMLSRFLYVCGALNSGNFPKDDITCKKIWEYFAAELEYENCDVECNAMYND